MKPLHSLFILCLVAVPGALLLLGAGSQPVSVTTPADVVARGKYLVAFGGCADCHTPPKFGPHGPEPDPARWMSGHPADVQLPPPPANPGPWFAQTAGFTAWAGPWGVSYAANLTPDTNTGIGIWTAAMFRDAMRDGKHMGVGRNILPPMPWQALRSLTDDDLNAIFAYLKSIQPIANRVPEPLAPTGPNPAE